MVYSDKVKGIFWFCVSRIALASLILSARYLANTVDPLQITTTQNIFALLFFIPIFYRSGFKKVVRSNNVTLQVIRGFIAVTGIIIWYCAFTKIALPEALSMSYSLPVVITIFAIIFLKEKLTWSTVTALILGFTGMMMIVRPDFKHGVSSIHMIILLAVSCWALANILNKVLLDKKESSETIVFYMSLTAVLFTIPLYWLDHFHLHSISIKEIGLFAFMGLMSNVAYISTSIAYNKNEMIAYLQPFDFIRLVCVIIFAYLLFGESINLFSVLGVITIILSNQMLFITKQSETELKKTNRKLSKIMADREENLKMVLHGLKNPISGIRGFLDLLSMSKKKEEKLQLLKEFQPLMKKGLDDMNGLVSKITDIRNNKGGGHGRKRTRRGIKKRTNNTGRARRRKAG